MSVVSKRSACTSSLTAAWAVSAKFCNSAGAMIAGVIGMGAWSPSFVRARRGRRCTASKARSPSPVPRYRPRAKPHSNMPNQSGRKGGSDSSRACSTSSAARQRSALSSALSTFSPPGPGPMRDKDKTTPATPRGRRREALAAVQLATEWRMTSRASGASAPPLWTHAAEIARTWCGSSAAATGAGCLAQKGAKARSRKRVTTLRSTTCRARNSATSGKVCGQSSNSASKVTAM
mmetsp:Transcript_28375/g.71260  ORF Transcript_28375/g.71260 Transcript_28375/m.71260 type:complete len:234 (-) Transcript_28375:187-888(-)